MPIASLPQNHPLATAVTPFHRLSLDYQYTHLLQSKVSIHLNIALDFGEYRKQTSVIAGRV